MISFRQCVEVGLASRFRPPCLVEMWHVDAYEFHRKREGARRVRRYLRRAKQRIARGER